MKRKLKLALGLLVASSFIFISGCKKSDSPGGGSGGPGNATVPVVTTTAVTNITQSTAQSGGTISSDGGAAVTARGVCYSYLPAPTINSNLTSDGTGTGTFVSNMSNMPPNQGFYLRAYATNSAGTGYGNEVYFVTSATPSLTTQAVTVTNNKWMTGSGTIASTAAPVTAKGICWNTSPNPTTANYKTVEGTGTGSFTSRIILASNSTYYIRAYATNSYGTGYGNEVTVTTGIAIGLLHGGGMIFDVDGTGQHGLIAALADQSTAMPWAPGAFFTTATNANSTTNGAANTTQIINVYGNSANYAAKICRDYRGGGFTDWFLPSSGQLYTLSFYQDVVGGFPIPCFLCNFYYWSSTEFDYYRARDQDFNYYATFGNTQKNQMNYVRAIRAF